MEKKKFVGSLICVMFKFMLFISVEGKWFRKDLGLLNLNRWMNMNFSSVKVTKSSFNFLFYEKVKLYLDGTVHIHDIQCSFQIELFFRIENVRKTSSASLSY